MKKNTKDFFDKKNEILSLNLLRAVQFKKLVKTVGFVAEKSSFYKHKKRVNANSARFASLEEFSKKIPLTAKTDLIQSEIYENLCVPKEKIAEVHFSSGTSNKPVFSFLTKKDIRESSEYLARTWHMQGVRKESVFAMFASYGLFSAGLINHYAIQNIGAFIIPVGNASALKSFKILDEFSADSCCAVASYYLYLITMAESGGINTKNLRLKNIVAGGEPFSEKQRAYIEKKLRVNMYDQYGLCEINTGIAGECAEKNGLHILADYVYPEIIDPKTEEVLGNDIEGELILTTLHKEASPLLRYRTGDITSITHRPCSCGRTTPRIARIKGRITDTLFYKGIKIEKPYIANALESLSDYLNPYIWQIELSSVAGKDEMTLKIIPQKNTAKTFDYVSEYFQKNLNLKIKVRIFHKDELSALGNGKIKNFVDNRRA